MGRPSKSRTLEIWTNGLHLGRWTIPAGGAMELSYDAQWVASEEGRPLSLSLPTNFDGVPIKGDKVGFFFDNLLPDSTLIRERVRSRFRTRSTGAFDLLEAIGRDCVGAVQLLPEGQEPDNLSSISATSLTPSDVERILFGATAEPRLSGDEDDGFRISIAGAQEKTALIWHKGRWCRPHGATPTTHIFKLPLGLVGGRQMDMSQSLENEWLCARLLREFGLPVATGELKQFGSARALVIPRFDRELHASKRYWLRLPQEDLCQATGTPSALKYESDGGPGLSEISRVLQGSIVRDEDLATLFRAQLLFWMLAATDGHAKNFSIRLLPQGRYRLTPLYDVLSAWPITGSRQNQVHRKKLALAMALRGKNKHYRISEIERRHFNSTAQACALGVDMEPILSELVAKTPAVIQRVAENLPRDFPAQLFESITSGLAKSASQLERMRPRGGRN